MDFVTVVFYCCGWWPLRAMVFVVIAGRGMSALTSFQVPLTNSSPVELSSFYIYSVYRRIFWFQSLVALIWQNTSELASPLQE